ncbi:uncharacterized protein Dana_GF17729, isoform B [Drosophila ananassae]|uniref:Uncharacterized protein, isoform B n=1 Tax=Drosophila ananassae TaxID=7217 RepID=A0A0P8YKP8_DROAN|nr:uncharacterized protein Dana_GF17729, isoform B [Drosophila ananassae]
MFWAYLGGMALFLLASAEIEPIQSAEGATNNSSEVMDTRSDENSIDPIAKRNHNPKFPYIVSIGANSNGYYKHLCMGVIIAKEFVLTAAHCIKRPRGSKPRKLYVAGGSDRLNSFSQTRFFVGDSGGPLINLKTEFLYGLLSYTRKACQPRTPYAFTRISTHSNWIEESMPKMLQIRINPGNYTKWKDRQ